MTFWPASSTRVKRNGFATALEDRLEGFGLEPGSRENAVH